MKNSNLSPWNIKEKDYPKNGPLKNRLKFLLRYGLLAPSGHNSQPWIFRINNHSLEILPDFNYARPAIDPDNRELFISLGAAVANIQIAADYFGLIYKKKYRIEPKNNQYAITLDFVDGQKKSENEDLFHSIVSRHTNRFDFQPDPVSVSILKSLPKIPGIKFTTITGDTDKSILAKLVHDSTIIWHQSQFIVDELKLWIRNDLDRGADGLILPTGFSFDATSIAIRARNNHQLVISSPALLILSSKNEDIKTWIRVGEAYEILALHLTSHNLAHGFFNNVVELKSARKKLNKILKLRGSAQLFLRLGHPTQIPSHSPRRPLKSFLF